MTNLSKSIKTTLAIFTGCLFISACAKDQPGNCCTYIKGDLNIVYLNSQGQDLLNRSTSDFYPMDKMKLYYLENGKKVELNNGMMDAPRGLSLITESTPARLVVFVNVGFEGDVISNNGDLKTGLSTTLLEIHRQLTDTIKTQWEKSGSSTYITKSWYNSKLVYDVKTGLTGLEGLDGFVITK